MDIHMQGFSQTSSTHPVNTLTFRGKVGSVYGIWLLNVFLTVITLGIYSFWGKTRMRKYIASSVELQHEQFEYTGTGGELFRGFLRAIPVLIVFYCPFFIFNPEKNPWVNVFIIPLLFLYMVAIYAAMRYRFSRTTWRGIRGRLDGSAVDYALKRVGYTIINIVTLGLYIPYSDAKLYKYVADKTWFGDTKASFNGNGKPLFMLNIATLIWAIPTLGLARLWYAAAKARYFYGNTTVGTLRLHSSYTGKSLLGLVVGNLLIVIFTVGLGTPVVICRNLRYFANNTAIVGDIAASRIGQSTEPLKSYGEGLEGVLGLDAGFA